MFLFSGGCPSAYIKQNDSQMYKLKLHTLWSPMKKDV